jgi:hypothetical protein
MPTSNRYSKCCVNQEGSKDLKNVLMSKTQASSACSRPPCAACQLAKQTRQGAGVLHSLPQQPYQRSWMDSQNTNYHRDRQSRLLSTCQQLMDDLLILKARKPSQENNQMEPCLCSASVSSNYHADSTPFCAQELAQD